MNFSHKKMRIIGIYFLFFAISGFSGLIYEDIWTHYLKLFLGHAAYAQTIVLILFMGGMAIGAGVISRLSTKIPNLLIGYALAEGIIGILGIGFHPVFTRLIDYSFYTLIPQLSSESVIIFLKYGCAVLLVFPQSILLGTTFPLMSAGIIRRFPSKPGRSLAILYFTNSLGGAIGILVSGFFLIPAVGLPGTLITAGILNLLIAVCIILMNGKGKKSVPERAIETEKTHGGKLLPQKPLIAFLLVAGLTGTASFLYEIGWIRMLAIVLGASTHAFELMLSAFILGLAIGGYAIRKRIDKLSSPVKTLGLIQIIMGSLALATLLSYNSTFPLMSHAARVLPKTDWGYFLFNIISHGLSMTIMLPATICAGMTLPLITFHLLGKGYGESSIGKVYSVNTIGAIVGVIAAVHLIMPVMGLKNVIIAGGGIDIAVGILLLRHAQSAFGRIQWYIPAGAVVVWLLICALFVDLDKYRFATSVYDENGVDYHQDQNTEVLFHQDGKTSTIDVVKYLMPVADRNVEGLAISSNGVWVGNLSLDTTLVTLSTSVLSGDNQVLLAALPLSLSRNAEKAATFGMGTGLTAYTLLADPNIRELDIIEIEKEVVNGSRFYGDRVAKLFNDPRCNIHIDDAKAFFSSTQKEYDIIVADPTYPWVSGVAGLFSTEFYRFISTHITPEGLFVQWLHLYELNDTLLASVIKAVSENFTDYQVYVTNPNFIAVVAGNQKIAEKPGDRIFRIPDLNTELTRIGVFHRNDLYLRKLGNKDILTPFYDTFPVIPNSDYYPILDNGAIKARFLGSDAKDILFLRSSVLPFVEVLTGETPLSVSTLSDRPTNSFAFSGMQARGVYEYCRSLIDTTFTPAVTLPQTIINDLHVLRANPETQEFNPQAWFQSFQRVMTLISPFTSAEDMGVIWSSLNMITIDFRQYFPPEIATGIIFYKMIGFRDWGNIIRFLSRNPAVTISDTPNNNFILSSQLLAYIALDRKDQAREVWNRYENKENPTLELRLLSSLLR